MTVQGFENMSSSKSEAWKEYDFISWAVLSCSHAVQAELIWAEYMPVCAALKSFV